MAAALERTLRAEEDHPVLLSHGAKYRSLLPSLALIVHLIDSVEAGTGGPVSRAAAERAVAWGEYLQGHATPLRERHRQGSGRGRAVGDEDRSSDTNRLPVGSSGR